MAKPKDSSKKTIAIVGGGATGVSMAWYLLQDEKVRGDVQLTLYHDAATLGGHSHTVPFEYEGKTYNIDIGVQYICPLMYPNTFEMLKQNGFPENVPMQEGVEIKLSCTFTEDQNWGNFPEYQKGPLFDKLYTDVNAGAGPLFRDAIVLNMLEGHTSKTVRELLEEGGDLYPKEWIANFLMPFLSILNGYGDDDQLYLAQVEDLFPIFTKLANPGPLAAWDSPGLGWQRFKEGSGTWIDEMAKQATGWGLITWTGSPVTAVYPNADGTVTVESTGVAPTSYDTVVLTTDMNTNRKVLDNTSNGIYSQQAPYISAEKFPLNPGSCFIHQDDGVLAPWLTTRDEIVQFSAWQSMDQPGGPSHEFGYDMGTTYSTYISQNMVEGLPVPVYVSMYGNYAENVAHPPAKDKWVIDPIDWDHGRFLGSFMYTSKTQLHNIQGLGNIWFAGNNTTTDSEEGALTSAMIIAEKLCPQVVNPWVLHPFADFMAFMMRKIMFPEDTTSSAMWKRFLQHGWKELVEDGWKAITHKG